MAENEDGQEKTEDATAKKEQEAKEKGQVARSKELGSVAVTMCGAAGIIMSGSMLYDIGREVFELNYQIPRCDVGQFNRVCKACVLGTCSVLYPGVCCGFIRATAGWRL